MQHKYGVEFVFCKPNESAEKVLELLIPKEEMNMTQIEKDKYGRSVHI